MVDIEKKLLETRNNRDVSFFDLHSIQQVINNDLELIFEIAKDFRIAKTHKFPFLKGKSIVNAFFESSTRTISSFDLAGKHLSCDTNNISSSSSVKKRESILDTLETLNSYNVSAIIIRCSESGIPEMLSKHIEAKILNAGDGWNQHPTQALLDGLTMFDHWGKDGQSFQQTLDEAKGKIITIVGDIKHSRVFGSLVRFLNMIQVKEIRIASPETLIPAQAENYGIKIFNRVEPALENTDVIYALRIQEERGAGGFIPSLSEYSEMFGISEERLNLAKKDAILMHPGPVIRGLDIHSELVSKHHQSRILQQTENGLAIRKALLWTFCERFDGKNKLFELL